MAQLVAASSPATAHGSRARIVGSSAAFITLSLAVAVAAWSVAADAPDVSWSLLVSTATMGALGGLLVLAHPSNRVGWVLAAVGLLFGVGQLAERYASASLVTQTQDWLPYPAAAVWVLSWIYVPAIALFFIGVPLLFPDGRMPSTRWRPLAGAAAICVPGATALAAVSPADVQIDGARLSNPLAADVSGPLAVVMELLPGILVIVLGLLAVVAFIARFHKSQGEERLQLRWLAYALALVAFAFLLDAITANALPDLYPLVFPFVQAAPLAVMAAVFVAIMRYRLLDLDLLVNRTLVYAALTASLLAVYLWVVTVTGRLFGDRTVDGAALLASACVAVLFAPVRRFLQRSVDRLLYGDRREPYKALALLAERLEAAPAPDAVLPTVARAVVEALRVPYAAVEVRKGDVFVVAADHGRTPGVGEEPGTRVPLQRSGREIGRLSVAARGLRDPLSSSDQRVLADLARQIVPSVENVRLAADLRSSRERLLLSQEEERRRIGRDLHDVLGPEIASIGMQLEACREVVQQQREGPALLEEKLDGALAAVREVLGDVRRVAHSLRPPVLDSLGLVGALEAQTVLAPSAVVLHVPAAEVRLPAAVESAAYAIALEALTNVRRHAGASRCTVDLTFRRDRLHLTVADNGRWRPGFDGEGMGLDSMRQRAEDVGGRCDIRPNATGGTTVEAALPIETEA